MRERIMEIVGDVEEAALSYTGSDMVGDGVLDSLTVSEIAAELEDEFGIEFDEELVTAENFASIDRIAALVERLADEQGV